MTALDHFSTGIGDPFPVDAVTDNLGSNYLFARVKVQSSDHIKLVTDSCHRCAFSWSWHPSRVNNVLHINSVTLTLLHPLNVGLEATYELVNQSVPWDVFSRRCGELVFTITITRLVILDDKPGLWPIVLNSACDELRCRIFGEELALICARESHEVRRSLDHSCTFLPRVPTAEHAKANRLSVHHRVTD